MIRNSSSTSPYATKEPQSNPDLGANGAFSLETISSAEWQYVENVGISCYDYISIIKL